MHIIARGSCIQFRVSYIPAKDVGFVVDDSESVIRSRQGAPAKISKLFYVIEWMENYRDESSSACAIIVYAAFKGMMDFPTAYPAAPA